MRRERTILWIGISISAALMAGLSIWKYQTFQMNGLDLAIFNQIFWNTVHGRLFQMSIWNQLSLGDHAEFFILALAPLYALIPRPETLLILQSIALAITGWPTYRIAKRFLPGSWPIVLGLATSFSPFLQNTALYEFHVLIFALPILLFVADAYLSSSLLRFLAFLFLALTVREDVSLVVAAFGIIAAIDRRGWKWIVTPIALSAAWFLGAIKLIGFFSLDGSYKFTTYYSWILDGITVDELARHFLTIPTLEFFLGILMPFLFLPLLRPKWLLLAALPLSQQILTGQGVGALTFQIHYVILFIPGLILATIESVRRWNFSSIPRMVLLGLFAAGTVYSIATLGPVPAAARMMQNSQPDPKLVAAKQAIVSSIPDNASVLASYDLLPTLSSRERLYSLHYAYPGKNPFSATDYNFPDPDEIILNEEDFLIFALNFPTLGWTRDGYQTGDDRLRALLSRGYGLVEARGPILHFRKGAPDTFSLFQDSNCPGNDLCLRLSLTLPTYEPDVVEPFILITLRDGERQQKELLPFGYGIYPPSAWTDKNLPAGKAGSVSFTVPLLLPDDFRPSSAEYQLVRPRGVYTLSGVRSGIPIITDLEALGPPVSFPLEDAP